MTNEHPDEDIYICPVSGKRCEYDVACVIFHCAKDETKKAILEDAHKGDTP